MTTPPPEKPLVVHVTPEVFMAIRKLEVECWSAPDVFDGARWETGVFSMLPEGTFKAVGERKAIQLVVNWTLGTARWDMPAGRPRNAQ